MKTFIAALIFCLANTLASAAQPLPPGASFDVGFSPRGQSLDVVLKGINSAKSEILVAAYSFTSKPVATALLAAGKRGVKVGVVVDQKANSGKYTAATFLANQGVAVRLNGNYPIFHHKFIVVDRQNLETGSFNFSAAAANKNAENVLLLWNVQPLAAEYVVEWKRLWAESQDLKSAY